MINISHKGMKVTTLNYNGLYVNENQVSSYQATTINVNKIFKKSYTKFHHGSLTTVDRYYKVRCQNSLQETDLVESKEILNQDSWQPLEGVVQGSVNYVPLSPISFLERAAKVYRNRISMIYGSIKYTWEETHRRCLKLASALNRLGVSHGDVVAVLSPNIPAMQELHFAIPMAGAIICPLNIRLDSNMISDLLSHSEAKILFVDYQLLQIAKDAINLLNNNNNTHSKPPLLFIISEPNYKSSVTLTQKFDYESLVESGDVEFSIVRPQDECDPISLNYTSGTTSAPKGVVFSHRGAYLNSLATVFIHGMREMPTYLWSLPMFHCNGWCFSWGTAIVGGTNVFLRRLNPVDMFDTIMIHKVTHMCGAPTILNMIVNYIENNPKKALPHRVEIMTGGAPPPPTVLSKIEGIGFHVTHIYGLTETYGPGTWCLWKPEWDSLPIKEQGKLKARQGVIHFGMEEVVVKDPITMEDVKCDGKSVGEIMFRGNTVMNGYFKDVSATEKAFEGGWFRSGDLAIKHQDGYIEVIDRSKDIVISGGENISTIVVETAIYSHPAVLEVAVVARPHDYWGQTPCAFVKLKDGVRVDAQEIIQYCRDHMPHYMVPRTIIFDDLPRNSTGKVQKFVLRERAKNLGSVY